jgi:hypothetical protein
VVARTGDEQGVVLGPSEHAALDPSGDEVLDDRRAVRDDRTEPPGARREVRSQSPVRILYDPDGTGRPDDV